ncbi:aminotransferase class III-fold pyridoxal phosphate-dependent enzyme [Arcicella aquatica]|uniref:Aminotransferase class III-fold pyridoxal phosphate-dependent enzyme n=1 Tax=Arcicella aquatica TaxID=217141 RepID=A0ABU5QNY6_9BACT|nr:aminotransferase class III-fold pyridoxal phosphate-dependent enzyme [Arcicella aquatica]MEA5258788.1 aminotransferase class III-fold pyridoxal phosphate-dependent enzyme [Arcicella aquatica]
MMNLFNVYPLYDITPVKAKGSYLWDKNGVEYLDLYGGHAVISIGHAHPYYVEKLTEQLQNIGFYSNSVNIPIQSELAEKLGKLSGCEEYDLFLCNSGAEANENALKVASFFNGRKKVIAFSKAFHGRTAGAVAVTDNKAIVAPINYDEHVTFLPFNDAATLTANVTEETCAVIIEGIQGVGGINVASDEFLKAAREACDKTGAILILDSVQCGYGRSGKFFSHQFSGIKPDLITTAKGMGNGFPIGGVFIAPKFKAKHGMLGTTFGGNHLACAAAVAVLDVMKEEALIENAAKMGEYLFEKLSKLEGIKELRGRGLMIGIEFEQPVDKIRDSLLFDHHIFCGYAGKHTLRLLPSLAITQKECDTFLQALEEVISVAA